MTVDILQSLQFLFLFRLLFQSVVFVLFVVWLFMTMGKLLELNVKLTHNIHVGHNIPRILKIITQKQTRSLKTHFTWMYKKNFPGTILPSILSSLYLKYPASAAAFHVSESSLSN